jgi:anti-anti-sigma regulatory factor
MQLSVEVSKFHKDTLFVCEGEIVRGAEADYLFELLTRVDRNDVVLDLQAIRNIDQEGLRIIVLSYQVLSAFSRRLLIRSPTPELLVSLERCYLRPVNSSVKAVATA